MAQQVTLPMVASGPVAKAFADATAIVRAIMGPIGSGKTSTSMFEVVQRTLLQPRSPVDGVKRGKYAFVRDTYRNLAKTTLPSWQTWFPPSIGEFTGGTSEPAVHKITMDLMHQGQPTRVEIIVEFIALGEHRVEQVMRGWEGTGVYLNEADGLPEDVLPYVLGRCGRYPSKTHGGAAWYGVWLDFNAPDTDSWIYRDFIEHPREGWAFFRQPSGFSPAAENTRNLPEGYYERQAAGQPDWYVRRFIKNEFGFSRDGRPIYEEEFNDAIHVASHEIEPDDLPLVLGLDAGLTPAAVVGQRRPNGQWRVLDELVTEGMGPTRFGEHLARLMAERYRGLPATAWADPSAQYGADKQAGERSWIEIVEHVSGVRARPAPTNKLIPRLEAVRGPLRRMIDGGLPGLVLSPRCRVLRKGFNSNYRRRRTQGAGGARYDDQPEKNDASHPHDALQYLLSGGGEHHEVMGRRGSRRRPAFQPPALDHFAI